MINYSRRYILISSYCQTDNAAPVDVVVVEHAASATPIETRLAPDGVG